MLAEVTLIGNVGRDPEIRQTTSGDTYARFSLATNKVVKGEKSTQWWDVTIFDSKKAEIVQNYVTRGSKVFIQGELNTREYQAKDGTTKTAIEVVVGRFSGKMVLVSGSGDAPKQASEGRAEGPAADPLSDEFVPF